MVLKTGFNNSSCSGNEENCKSEEGSKWPQILAIITVSFGTFTNGVLFAWSSPFAKVIVQDKVNYNISEYEASLFIVVHPVGMIIGSLFLFKLAKLLGRKRTALFLAVPHLITWIIVIFARTKWEFYAARVINGIGDATMFCSIPIYVGEISTPTVRGFWGNVPTFSLYLGQVFLTVLGSYFDVKTTAYMCIGFPIIFLTLGSLLPNSPYYLIKEGKYEEAKASIKWLRRKPDVEQDFQQLKADVERQMSEQGTWSDLFSIVSNRKALRAGIFLRSTQQLSGVAVFASYTQTVFTKAGGNVSPEVSSIIFVALICIFNLICSPVVEKFGRKPSYLYSLLFTGILLLSLSIYFFLDQHQLTDLSSFNWIPLTVMLLWVVTYSFGLGIVPTLMLGELFSASVKEKCLCLMVFVFGLSVFLTTYLFNLLTENLGLYGPFLLFGVSCLVSTVFTIKWVPETKGKTLEQIQQGFRNK